jgi:(p)ppGpp synthase/HD superfamily hydrolase
MSPEPITLEGAHDLAASKHVEPDKLGVDYMKHVRAVAGGLVDFDLDVQIAGMLHDVVEDTKTTLDDLRTAGVSERSLAGIEFVSLNLHPRLTYAQAIDRITSSRDATLVKIADNAHNSRPDRVAALQKLTGKPPKSKYVEARHVLWSAVPDEDVVKIVGRIAPSLLERL